MKTLGTLLEWMDHNPKAFLTNDKLIRQSKEVSIFNVKKLDKPERFRYPCRGTSMSLHYVDTDNYHSTPCIYFGPQATYIARGEFEYMAGVVYHPSGCGSTVPVSQEMLDDPNWYEGPMEYLK